MKKKNFISDEQVKNLVANGEYDNRGYYIVPFPNQVDPDDTSEQFKDFVKKAKKEVFNQGKVKGADNITEIVCDNYFTRYPLDINGLSFISFKEHLMKNQILHGKKITHTFEVVIPYLFKRTDCSNNDIYSDNDIIKWVRKMVKTVAKEYKSDDCRTDVNWKILNNRVVQFEVVQYQFK